MSLKVVSRDLFARKSGLLADDGSVSRRGVAELLRASLTRWGYSPRAMLLRYVRNQLDAAGLREAGSMLAGKVLDDLIDLKECQEVRVRGDRYVVPGGLLAVSAGEGSASLLGFGDLGEYMTEILRPSKDQDPIRRIQMHGDVETAVLNLAGAHVLSIEEWLQPMGHVRHAARRTGRLVADQEFSISQFWHLLTSAAAELALPLGPDAEVRVLCGEPGGFFGRYDADECEGRWAKDATDGAWCAVRRGFGSSHWHPTLLLVDGQDRRALDLFDEDELRWALLGRGLSLSKEERVSWIDGEAQISFYAPRQLLLAMDLLGPRQGTWRWSVSPTAPNFWNSFS